MQTCVCFQTANLIQATRNMTETNISMESRLGKCEVCNNASAIYSCPKCEFKTCSVVCYRLHKRELDCDGKRDRTKFLPLSEMTERELQGDYCFLEECTRYTEQRKHDRIKNYTQQKRHMPAPLHRLRAAAQQRGTKLRLLLDNFTRRKENTTYVNMKEKRIYWHINWLFVQPASSPMSCVSTRVDEQLTLAEVLQTFLDGNGNQQHRLLKDHRTAGIGLLRLWLRAEGVRCSSTRCFPLSTHKSLRDNLAGKTIVEYPSIFVSFEPQPPRGFQIIDSDDDLDAEPPAVAIDIKSKADEESQPAAKRSKVAKEKSAASKDQSEPHDVYELAARFEAEESGSSSESSSCSSNEDEHSTL